MLNKHLGESDSTPLLIQVTPSSRPYILLVTVIRSVLQLLYQRYAHVQLRNIVPASVLALQLVASPLPWSQYHRQPAFHEHVIVSSCIHGG